jgi:endo-1,4-beta-xylanase
MFFKHPLALLLIAGLAPASGAAAADDWESFPDGSTGQVTEFQGVGGVAIPAYIRKPSGPGPFPVVVLLHGGRHGSAPTYGLGRSAKSPTADFIKQGWAVYSVDYRPAEQIAIVPIETDDTIDAIKTVRRLPFIDPARVGLMGGSHGANVASKVISRIDTSGAVLCAPAAIDLIEVKKAVAAGEKVVPILLKLIRDMEKQYGASAEEIEKDPARYGYHTAMTDAADVRCPVLIVNARNDDNSPIPVIDAYVQKLRAAGRTVETYLPATGGHGFYWGRPDTPEYRESTRLAVAFFQKQFDKPVAAAAKSTGSEGAAPKPPINYGYGSMDWVDPDRGEPAGTKYKTFHSATIKGDVSYLVYLPPDYDQHPEIRYPVLYELHASGGTPQRDATGVLPPIDRAMRAGKIPPMIVVFPNGLRGATMYSDTKNGEYPLESVIIKDLIPHIDATYRTIASRAGRALDGFSMGGFGAAHLGFKYPELFGVVSIQAPPLLGPDLTQPLPTRAWSKLFATAMGGDLAYFRENDPFALAAKNADALRDRSFIRIICHIENENWLAPQCEKLHRVLMDHTIPHQFLYLSNVKSHNRGQVTKTLGDAGLLFFGVSFPQVPTEPAAKR